MTRARSTAVYRGQRQNPLYVTAIGLGNPEAKRFIVDMQGENRIPTLLKRVDRLTKLNQ